MPKVQFLLESWLNIAIIGPVQHWILISIKKKSFNCCRKKPKTLFLLLLLFVFNFVDGKTFKVKNFHWTETWMPAVRKILSKLFTANMGFSLSFLSHFLSILLLLFLWLLSSGLLGHPHYVGGFEHIGWMTIRAWLICAKIDGDQWDAAEEITPFFWLGGRDEVTEC